MAWRSRPFEATKFYSQTASTQASSLPAWSLTSSSWSSARIIAPHGQLTTLAIAIPPFLEVQSRLTVPVAVILASQWHLIGRGAFRTRARVGRQRSVHHASRGERLHRGSQSSAELVSLAGLFVHLKSLGVPTPTTNPMPLSHAGVPPAPSPIARHPAARRQAGDLQTSRPDLLLTHLLT